MQKIKDIAMSVFEIDEQVLCFCFGGHEICLNCKECRKDRQSQVVDVDDDIMLNEYLDHTLLKPEAQYADIVKLCDEGQRYGFKSICINPSFVSSAKQINSEVKICTVIGFPLGAHTSEVKLFEAETAINEGASELDMVINIGALKDQEYSRIIDEIWSIKQLCKEKDLLLKVIIETALLQKEEIIIACLLAKKAGADFVKTSTGFANGGATVSDVSLMRQVVGTKMGVKASGGIRTREDAVNMLRSGANRIGTSNAVSMMNEK